MLKLRGWSEIGEWEEKKTGRREREGIVLASFLLNRVLSSQPGIEKILNAPSSTPREF